MSPTYPSLTWFHRSLIAVTLAMATYLLTPSHSDPDLWGHLQFGRDCLQFGLPATTTYSYTAEGYPWVNHETLAEVGMAWLELCGGIATLIRTGTMLGLVVTSLLVQRTWKQTGDPFTACTMGILVTLNLVFHWALRPQLISFACFTILLALLDTLPSRGSFDLNFERRSNRLWILVPVFVVWTNSHGGFAAGLAILWVFLLGRTLEYRYRPLPPTNSTFRRLVTIAVATAAATLINPYSLGFHCWMWEALTIPRPEISEWHGLQSNHPQTWLFATLVATWLVILVVDRKDLDATQVVIMAMTAWQASLHHRHIAFFALEFGWWCGPGLGRLISKLRGAAAEEPFGADLAPRLRQAIAMVLALITCLTGTAIWHKSHTIWIGRNEYPVSALEFITKHRLAGNAIVTFNWSEYALAAWGARSPQDKGLRVSCDGRFETCYPHEIRDMHFDFILGDLPGKRNRSPHSPPIDSARILRVADPQLALLDRKQPISIQTMEQTQGAWIRLYQDSIAEVWGRANRFDDPTDVAYLPPNQREFRTDPEQGRVAWPALPHPSASQTPATPTLYSSLSASPISALTATRISSVPTP